MRIPLGWRLAALSAVLWGGFMLLFNGISGPVDLTNALVVLPAALFFGVAFTTILMLGQIWRITEGGRRPLGDRLAVRREAWLTSTAPPRLVGVRVRDWLEARGQEVVVHQDDDDIVVEGVFGTRRREGRARLRIVLTDNGEGGTRVHATTAPYWRTHVVNNGRSAAAIEGLTEVLAGLSSPEPEAVRVPHPQAEQASRVSASQQH